MHDPQDGRIDNNFEATLILRTTTIATSASFAPHLRTSAIACIALMAFRCALGITISSEATPRLNMLVRRTLADAGLATYKAKDFYKRIRPFMTGNEAICPPKDEAALRKDPSYPSGHSALGWAWGLVLSEIAPERSNAIIQRALAK